MNSLIYSTWANISAGWSSSILVISVFQVCVCIYFVCINTLTGDCKPGCVLFKHCDILKGFLLHLEDLGFFPFQRRPHFKVRRCSCWWTVEAWGHGRKLQVNVTISLHFPRLSCMSRVRTQSLDDLSLGRVNTTTSSKQGMVIYWMNPASNVQEEDWAFSSFRSYKVWLLSHETQKSQKTKRQHRARNSQISNNCLALKFTMVQEI